MSTQSSQTVVASCRPSDVDPVTLPASALESTAPSYLRELKRELAAAGKVAAGLTLSVSFDEDCSFATQAVAEEIRDVVRAASFVGASQVEVTVESVACEEKVEPALAAAAERADREGVALDVERPAHQE